MQHFVTGRIKLGIGGRTTLAFDKPQVVSLPEGRFPFGTQKFTFFEADISDASRGINVGDRVAADISFANGAVAARAHNLVKTR